MTQLCLPSFIYLVLSIIGIVIYIYSTLIKNNPNIKQNFTTTNALLVLVIKLVFMIGWTFFLNWLCSVNMTALAWIILCLPVLFFLFVVFFLIGATTGYALKH